MIYELIKLGIDSFLFGSNSTFNDVCFNIVKIFQVKFPNIKLIGYPCNSESFCVKGDKDLSAIASNIMHKNIKFKFYDETRDYNFKGRGGYIERNKKMISDSDVCVFYYDSRYSPPSIKDGIAKTKLKAGQNGVLNMRTN